MVKPFPFFSFGVSSAFKPAGSAFGATSVTSSGGLFGTTSQPTNTGLFGANPMGGSSLTFGATSSPFGAAATPFGQQQQQQQLVRFYTLTLMYANLAILNLS